ncbi:MAG: trigger factor [Candidatus Eisenbacteria bacterium]|nr:trigger factor [Candidatus Eisenbacteria bacterium]
MKLSVRDSGAWQHTLEVEIPEDEVERRIDETARGIQRRASLPGFRKGHVPIHLVRQHFADAVEQEFLESFVPRATSEAIAEAKLEPVVPALVRNLQMTPGRPFTFEAVVDVRPEVEPRDYRGIAAVRHPRTVDDAAVEGMMQRLREESAVFVDLDRPAERGDFVLVDSVRVDANGKRLASTRARNLRIQLGAPDVLPDLENGLLASVEGQERTVDIAYPADYPNTALAGQNARYQVRVRKIQAQKLRDLDDTFARDVFQMESIDALRSRIRENLEREERARTDREVEAGVTDELVKRNPVELPDRLVRYMLDRVIREATGDRPVDDALRAELEQRYRPGVERSLKREFILLGIARKEQVAVGDEDVAKEIERIVQSEPRQAARVRAHYQSAERRQGLKESLLERKALEWVIGAAVIRDEVAKDAPLVVPATR